MFGRKINVFIIRTIVVGIINMVTLYFMGHYIGPGPIGTIAYGASFIQMFFMFSELGFGQAHIKRISEGKDIEQCIGTYFIIKSTIVLVLTIIVISVLLIKTYILHSGFNNPEQERVIYLLLIPMILIQLSTVALNTFEARRESAKVSIPLIFGPLAKAPVTIAVALLGYGVYGLVVARYVNGIVVLFLAFYLLKYTIKIPELKYFKSYFNFAYKAFVLFILVQASMQLDKLMIGSFDSIESVGMYSSIQSIMALLAVIPNAVGSLLFPTISEQDAKGNREKIREYTLMAEKYITMLLLPIAIVLVFFSKSIIFLLLGEKFVPAAFPLSILSVYFFVNGIRKPVASLLAGTDKMGLLVRISMISVLTNILLNFVLIPKQLLGIHLAGLGMNGAAIATFISGIVYTLLCKLYAYRKTGIKTDKKIYLLYLAGALMFLFFFTVDLVLPIENLAILPKLLTLLIYCLTGLALYIAILFFLKEFSKKEINLVLESINPKKMKEYINAEIKD